VAHFCFRVKATLLPESRASTVCTQVRGKSQRREVRGHRGGSQRAPEGRRSGQGFL